MSLQERIEKLIEDGYSEKISNHINYLENLNTTLSDLPKEIINKINDFKYTPIDEPELYEAIKLSDIEGKSVIAKYLFTNDEINKYSSVVIGNTIHIIIDRITNYKLEDGTFKTTPNTENCMLPNFIEAEELLKLAHKESVATKDKDKRSLSTELFDKTLGYSQLNIDILTDWEKALVYSQINASIIDASLSSVGKLYTHY